MNEVSSTPHRRGGAHRRASHRRATRPAWVVVALILVIILAASAGGYFAVKHFQKTGASAVATTTSTQPTTTTSTTQAPGPGFVAGKVTAIGDSVLIDYQGPLTTEVPGIVVDGSVSRQWYQGEQILAQMKAANQLGATVIVALGTNGPITTADFDSMMTILSGASKVLFVNVHVDQPWQDPNNAVLAAGVTRYPTTELVDWNALASENPSWFGADGTHLAIGGTGAQALASLISSKLS